MVVQLGHRADGRAGSPHRAVLVNGDSRQNTFDFLDLGFIHAIEKLPRVRRETLDVPPLSFGIENVESEARLSRTTDSGDHRQLVERDFYIDVFKVVLLCAGNRNRASVGSGVSYFISAHPRPPLSSSQLSIL